MVRKELKILWERKLVCDCVLYVICGIDIFLEFYIKEKNFFNTVLFLYLLVVIVDRECI